MANTFITPNAVAKLALPTLLNYFCFAGLIYRDYSREFKKRGDSVTIRKPAVLEAIEFDGDLTGEYQNITETYTDVKMDTVLVVPVEVSAKDMTLDIVDFNTQVIEPAMQALAQKVDVKAAQLYKDIPYYQDIDETSAATIIASLLGARRIQSDNKVPKEKPRYAVMSPLTTALLLGLDAFRDLDKTGSNKALREASLGRVFSYEYYENQNIQHHTRGTTDGLGALTNTEPKGETSLDVDTLGTGTINKGTLLTIADVTGQYVVTEDAAISGNAVVVKIYPGLEMEAASAKVVTFHGPAATDELATSRDNIMFQRNAFSMVSAPMAEPIGGALGKTLTYKGLTINVVYGYGMNQMKNIITFSILCGFKTLTPELAVRLWDAS